VRIVHLSDIHYRNTEKSKSIVIKMIEDLKKMNNELKVDLILITGDLIDKGGKSFGGIDIAFKKVQDDILDSIKNQLDIDRDKIIFCIGNHDINSEGIDKFAEVGLKEILSNKDTINEFIEDRRIKEDSSISRIKEYKKFERGFASKEADITNFESNYMVNINDIRVGITAFNSSWRCTGDKNEIILFGTSQISKSISKISDCDIKIAMIHHSFEHFQEYERLEIKDNIFENYDYLFLGHVHNNDSYMRDGLLGSIFVSIAQSNSSENIEESNTSYSIGYSIIDIGFKDEFIRVSGRKYSDYRKQYVSNTDIYGDNGYKEFSLLSIDNKSKERDYYNIVKNIREVHIDDLNEHLLSYKTDSNAPKTIEEIFVDPNIISKENGTVEEGGQREKVHSLEEICMMDKNILIFGVKESGKTILMDKILIEFIEQYSKYKKIPVRIDLSKKIVNVDNEIKKYLSLSKHKVNELIQENKIILLIDNLNFSDEGELEIKKVKRFLNNNKNIRVIATCQTKIESEPPIQVAKDDIFNKFMDLYITYWRSKQIENIINIWYSNSEKIVTVNEVVKIFKNTKMSVNPLNISMFLWIIERQQNYRLINKGKLMECFFEYLLEKLHEDDVYSDTFDYTNKIRLLSTIAFEIYNNKYKLQYSSLLVLVEKYLNERRFPVDYNLIVEYFINKGILTAQYIEGKKFVTFRFECFYRFFITQYMIYNSEFREEIFKKDNYLKFQDEIDYFTGIRRDEVELLKKLDDRMNKNFEEFSKCILESKKNFDYYYEVKHSIFSDIDFKEIEKNKSNIDTSSINNKKNDKTLSTINGEVSVDKVNYNLGQNEIDVLLDSWTIVAKVLKNTEETDEENLKNNIYIDIIKCSIIHFLLYKQLIDRIIKYEVEKSSDREVFKIIEDMEITSKILPIINSEYINEILATTKLQMVIEDEINFLFNDSNKDKSSEIEKYLSVMLLLKIDRTLARKYVKKLVNTYKCNYMKDIITMKLINEYYKNNNNDLDAFYKDMITDTILKKEKQFVKSNAKTKIIESLEKQKRGTQMKLLGYENTPIV